MDGYLNIRVKGHEPIKVLKKTKLYDLSRNYQMDLKYPILLAKVNNQLSELTKELTEDSEVEFLDITNPNGFKTYQRSTIFLMICAAKEILGKKTRIVVEHSINKNLYCEIPDGEIKITDELLKQIQDRMVQLAEKDIVIEKLSLSMDEGMVKAREFGLQDKEQILKYRTTSNVNFYKLDWFYDYFYGQIVLSTGYLKIFKLVKEMNGFLLQFPDPNDPHKLNELKDRQKISKVFMESSKWAKILKVDTVGALNDVICKDKLNEFIRINEGLHEKKITNIADIIYQNNKRVVLIAGPSSSGKTTFAKRLGLQLKVNGLNPRVISLDDYYLDRDSVPIGPDGKPDFECLESIDVNQFNIDLQYLLAGKKVDIPKFNFASGQREYKGDFISLSNDDVIIIEGIHGLNDKVAENVDGNQKFKIFISALTQLNIDDHNRIPTTDTRLIRRIVRDHKHRGFSALTTLAIWPAVTRGEALHIFPYQEKADTVFNSALIYEMCVLKQFAQPLLFGIDKTSPEYTEARRLLKFLDSFIGVSSEFVPQSSIIREFIGGSCFE